MKASYQLLLLSSSTLSLAKTAQVEIPRGVAPESAHLYRTNPEGLFGCISDPQFHIPLSQVNDDYCDCPDGSDEPGTAACSYLNKTQQALPGYYCENKLHTPAYISFSRVNDGICDYDECCDGSDEWEGVGGVKCENRCKEIGKAARKAAEEAEKALERGRQRNAELVAKAITMRKQVETDIITVKGEIVNLEADLENKKRVLMEAEIEEKSRVVVSPEGSKRGKVGVLVQLAKERIEEYKEYSTSMIRKKADLEGRLERAETILKGLKDTYNPNFNDEGVKAAVRGWEDYLASRDAETTDETIDDLADLMNDEINWAEWEGQDEDEVVIEDIYQIEKYLPENIRLWVHSQLDSLRQILIENGILAHRPATSTSSDSPSSHLSSAREAVTNTESSLSSSKTRLEDLEKDLQTPYGDHDVFRSLKGTCIDASSGEYTYSHCFFDKAWQKSNKDQSRTHLGDFTNIEIREDEETGEEITVLKYENGQRCWNGPARSAIVSLKCEAEDVVHKVFEGEKCVYQFEAGTPAVCGWGKEKKENKEKVAVKEDL